MDVFEQVNDVGVAVEGALGDVDGVEQGLDLVGFEGFADGLRPLDQEVPGLGAGCPGGKLGDVFDAVCLGVFHDDGGAEAFFEVHRVYSLTASLLASQIVGKDAVSWNKLNAPGVQ